MRSAGHLGEELEQGQIGQQQNAVDKFLNSVYKPSSKNEKKINKLYKKTYQTNLPKTTINKFRKNQLLDEAFARVRSLPSMQGIKENNYQFLHEVDRDLARKYKSTSDNSERFYIGEVKKDFNKKLTSLNPDYAAANKAAQPKIVRENLETRMNVLDENITAKNLYTKLIGNRKTYAQTLRDLKNFPKARQMLMDMRQGWKQYSKPKESGQAYAQGFSFIDQARNILDKVNDFLRTTSFNKATEQKAKYIHSKEWQQDLKLLENIKNERGRYKKTLDMVSKMGQSYGLNEEEINHLKDLITKE